MTILKSQNRNHEPPKKEEEEEEDKYGPFSHQPRF